MIDYHRPDRLVEKSDYCIQGQGHSEGSKCRYLSRWYFLNRRTFCYQTRYCDASEWAGVSCKKKKNRLLFPRSRSQQGLVWSIYDSFYCIFWIADPFATKLCLMVHYHKPECLMKKLDCCVQGQGHGKIAKCQWLFIQMLSSELLILILPNLVQWCISMSQPVFEK